MGKSTMRAHVDEHSRALENAINQCGDEHLIDLLFVVMPIARVTYETF
jgi:hypothetical protein